MGIEPTFEAWEAPVLPLNYTRGVILKNPILSAFCPAHNQQKNVEARQLGWRSFDSNNKKWPTIVGHLVIGQIILHQSRR